MADIKKVRSWAEFLRDLAELGDDIRRTIELECDAFDPDPVASESRRTRAITDYQFFCQTYFPHYVPTNHFSLFQQFIFDRLPDRIDGAEDAREVHEAPRGEAKSTYETQLGTLWCICRADYLSDLNVSKKARKHLIGIIMNTLEQSAEMLESIKAELDSNPRLALDFPKATGQGKVWQATTAVSANNIKIRVGGTGKKLRGMKHGPYRPDLLFLDDLENDENVVSLEQRLKTQNYVLKALLGLAPPMGGMDVFWVGTSLHYDAGINRVARKPGWRKRVFKAIMKWPDRMDLWEQWEALYTVSGDDDEKENAEAIALAYYKQNRELMDAGAILSWPDVRPLYRLMCIRATDHGAFSQEYQNEAGNDEDAPFKDITFWVNNLASWIFFGAIDPSMGKNGNKKRDPSAILVGGLDREKMILDVVEASICRRVPDLIISQAIDYQIEYQCLNWSVECVAFQEFLYTELLKRAAQKGVMFPATAGPTGRDKELAILSLQPYIKNGSIRLHRSQTTLIEQLKFWGEADHDDGPDALEMLHKISLTMGGEWLYTSAGQSSRGRNQQSDGWGDD